MYFSVYYRKVFPVPKMQQPALITSLYKCLESFKFICNWKEFQRRTECKKRNSVRIFLLVLSLTLPSSWTHLFSSLPGPLTTMKQDPSCQDQFATGLHPIALLSSERSLHRDISQHPKKSKVSKPMIVLMQSERGNRGKEIHCF